MPDRDGSLFLGFDFSTQSLKATLIDASLRVVRESGVQFDAELPAYKTDGGVHRHADGLTVTSPTLMWVSAFDRILGRMADEQWPLRQVAAVSGSGQQHGSVWWRRGARRLLGSPDAGSRLSDRLERAFSVPDSPVWMDSSTAEQCRRLEAALGGAQALAELTGSRAYERFTGNQIARIRELNPQAYGETERISLVSSFAASMLIGDYAPIDAADGSGMNLMDLRKRDWAPQALAVVDEGLAERLGSPVPSHASAGAVHRYFVERFGFAAACRVIVFSGDNPNSLAGLRLQRPGDVAVSLGTSDTVFGSLNAPRPSAVEGHVFANPIDPCGYMALICYKNGSLTRESVRNRWAGGTWSVFNEQLASTPAGNGGRIGFYVLEPEITPPILKTGITRFDGRDRRVRDFPPAAEARAVVEGQLLSMRLHARRVGLVPHTLLATGGASANASIVRVMADVFGVAVCVGEQPNSASLGAAYRALHGWRCAEAGGHVPFAEVVGDAPAFRPAAEPDAEAHRLYTDMLERYERLEGLVCNAG